MFLWPTFLIIGAPRSGTTSLYEYLKKIPEVFMCSIKEPNYFSLSLDPNFLLTQPIRNKQKYQKLFSRVINEKAIGEASSNYLWDPKAPKIISETIPTVKIIMILRNPIDRAFSHYLMHLGNGTETRNFREVIEDALKPDTNDYVRRIIEAGYYYEQIQRYQKFFSPNQIKIFIFEEFDRNPKEVVKETMDFLGIDGSLPDNLNVRYNQYAEPRGKISSVMLKSPQIKRVGKKFLPSSLGTFVVKNLLNKKTNKPELPKEDGTFLADLYLSDSTNLQKILGKQIPWEFLNMKNQ